MSATILDIEFKKVLRQKELLQLKVSPSWEQVLFRTVVPPAYTVEFSKIADDLPVTISVNGTSGRRGSIVRDRESGKLHFFTAEFDIPWVETWFQQQHAGLPVPVQGALDSPDKIAARLTAEIRRKMDTYMWDGNAGLGVDGMLDIDASPDGLSNAISTGDGRREFVETLIQANEDSKTALISGSRVLAIDSAKLPWLVLPYEDASANLSVSVLDMISKFVDRIVPVENTALNGKALMHFYGEDNAEWFHSTPRGVQFVLSGGDGENKTVKVFHQAGIQNYRDAAFQTVTGL